MAELLSYGSKTSQALHLSTTTQNGDLVGGDGSMVQPLYLDITGVLPEPPGLTPEIIDSLELVPVLVDSWKTLEIPEVVFSSEVKPTITDSEAEKPKPEVVDSSEVKPTITDSESD